MKNEKGVSLIEVLVALGLLGIIAVAFLVGLATASKAMIIADERATAESLARSQVEYVKSQDYEPASWTYALPSDPPLWWDSDPPTVPDSYFVSVSAELLDDPTNGSFVGIQKIIITVKHGTEAETAKEVMTLEDYKVNR